MAKKYEIRGDGRIVALRSFGDIVAGSVGGFVESEKNLSHYDNAWVYGNARVSGNALVYGDARVSGNALVYGDAWVSGDAWVRFGELKSAPTITDMLRVSLGAYPVNGVVRLYKRVKKNLASEHDPNFVYPASGKVTFDFDPDPSISCARGGHFSTCENWPKQNGYVHLAADIRVEDIICVLEGKARVKRAFIVGVCDY